MWLRQSLHSSTLALGSAISHFNSLVSLVADNRSHTNSSWWWSTRAPSLFLHEHQTQPKRHKRGKTRAGEDTGGLTQLSRLVTLFSVATRAPVSKVGIVRVALDLIYPTHCRLSPDFSVVTLLVAGHTFPPTQARAIFKPTLAITTGPTSQLPNSPSRDHSFTAPTVTLSAALFTLACFSIILCLFWPQCPTLPSETRLNSHFTPLTIVRHHTQECPSSMAP